MCGRYYIQHKMYDNLPAFMIPADYALYTGDVCPSEKALILRRGCRGMEGGILYWGYPSKNAGGLVINARVETLHEKPMFCEDVMHRRCLIPASGFYEWDKEKQKATIRRPEKELIYFAGFYGIRDGQERFVIITRQAAGEMCRIHDRMPLIIPGERMEEWFSGDYEYLLKTEAPVLQIEIENEQLSFL